MHVNSKMIPVQAVPEWGKGGDERGQCTSAQHNNNLKKKNILQ
jgi:hypothetical protein